ncbi:hypothetical protein SCLCIDRAFT_1062741 [Scleroderma citrinum Foug A]|uniref:Condensation domain-containing protein n=1 Tax=Scleroderma citrinum Foug A TaxID=1036808 RepID=A0A0C3DDF1_9AGAM|nr:hypothetical protein SCLCIDRAFT_1062741 [Scleroderma citrinum Foug A]
MHLVSPKLPTVLHHQTAVNLAYDLWFYDANGVYVLPGTIDVEKFKNALSNTLQLYPHAAGQLRCQDGRWFIELTNTPVPVDVSYVEEKSSSSILQDDWVWQKNLTFLSFPQRTHASLINGTEPLLRCQLTFFLEETCIGISWHHILGQ